MKHQFLAVDLGATSGRTILGTIENERVSMAEITRFSHDIISMGNHLYWDFLYLYNEIEKSLGILSSRGIVPMSIGVDTWGVDIVCFGADGQPLSNPISY
ncbi:MAG: rhamnulokinase, partial [Paramuribaculum sp.]|nr:rhamnulokinase [Paramuribaculum sp.]